ncbi:MAG: AbrB/MazE/SpoVT family DNA-binding domain-containing protein [Anaerolineales bacterium]|nr:AbrB/MazE/SpoVT family DNA-binding domain-containing protein [Anaerolineales bacterium]
MTIIKVGRRGQITIPRSIRNYLDIEEGDRIAFMRLEGKVILTPMKNTLRDLKGSVSVNGKQNFDEIREHVIENHVSERVTDD